MCAALPGNEVADCKAVIVAHVAAIESQRDALLVAIKRLRALFAGDPGGKFVVMREGGEGASFTDLLFVGEAMAQADIAIDAAAQSGFMEDGAWWPAEARKEGVVYDGDCP